jgi:hypothetical protein
MAMQMRRLVAIALITGCAASSQAQRVAAIGATTGVVTLDSASAPGPSTTRHIALAPANASTATIDDGRHGNVWIWAALGTLAGAAVGGAVMQSHCSHRAASCAEFSIPLGAVIGGLGGGMLGALTFYLSQERPRTSAR